MDKYIKLFDQNCIKTAKNMQFGVFWGYFGGIFTVFVNIPVIYAWEIHLPVKTGLNRLKTGYRTFPKSINLNLDWFQK
jgi:hypothetical protein